MKCYIHCLICRWVRGASPARADIAGGWSDTPPISYEHGGAVTNAAILVDGKVMSMCHVSIGRSFYSL